MLIFSGPDALAFMASKMNIAARKPVHASLTVCFAADALTAAPKKTINLTLMTINVVLMVINATDAFVSDGVSNPSFSVMKAESRAEKTNSFALTVINAVLTVNNIALTGISVIVMVNNVALTIFKTVVIGFSTTSAFLFVARLIIFVTNVPNSIADMLNIAILTAFTATDAVINLAKTILSAADKGRKVKKLEGGGGRAADACN